MRWWWCPGSACFVLDQHAEMDLYSASSLKQQSVGGRQCRSTRTHYSDSEPTSLCSYSIILSEEATNTNFIVFDLTRPGLESTICRTRGEHASHYTTDESTICRTRGEHASHYTTDAVLIMTFFIINRQWLYRPYRIFTLYEIQISVNKNIQFEIYTVVSKNTFSNI